MNNIILTELFWTSQDVLICICSLIGELWPRFPKSLFSKLEPRNIPYRPTSFSCFSHSLYYEIWTWGGVGHLDGAKITVHHVTTTEYKSKGICHPTMCHVGFEITFKSLMWLDSIHQSIWGFLLLLLFWLSVSEDHN